MYSYTSPLKCLILFAFLFVSLDASAQSSPEALQDGIELRRIGDVQRRAVRLAYDPTTNEFYYNTVRGNIWRIDAETGAETQIYASEDHGLSNLQGFMIGPDGHMYLVGNEQVNDGLMTVGIILRAERVTEGADERQFIELARSVPFYRTAFFDHLFNAIVLSPDGTSIYVNSGANTDHGENQSVSQEVPDVREMPITTKIFKLPANGQNIVLENDEAALMAAGYLFSDGVRNSFDLAFNAQGELFAAENSGDRDDPEEINWIREGHHYGFPWRMGTTDTPQQFAGYDPANDPFINPAGWAAGSGFFYDDPSFPTVPEGVTFTDPIVNLGPDADIYRDEADGLIKDASDEGVTLSSLTPHRSPLGLAFDTEFMFAEPYTGDGFVASWTSLSSSLLEPFNDESEDILHLEMTLNEEGTNYEMNVTQIIKGFNQPVDLVVLGHMMYVLENNNSAEARPGLWEVTFPMIDRTSTEDDNAIPASFLSMESYPNPASQRVYLRYQMDVPQHIDVEVFDVLGRKRMDVTSAWYNEGQHEIPVELQDMEPGVYLVRTASEHGVLVRRVTVLR